MKTYPSIPRATGQSFREFQAFVFDKLDGSNLRFEWTKKNGWEKFGTRTRLFDESDEMFGSAKTLFLENYADDIEKVFTDCRYEKATAFCEYYGPNSFAGVHDADDEFELTLFDVSVHRRGILGPKEFLKVYGHLHIPNYLGHRKWTRGFVEEVRTGKFSEGITFEGVVGKGGHGHDLVMAKAKTEDWVEKVKNSYGDKDASRILNS